MNKRAFYEVVDRARLRRLLDRTETPSYVYFPVLVDRQAARVRDSFGDAFELYYAVKANPHPQILARMARLGIGADVASGGELRAAIDAGIQPERIEFSGPGKSLAELRAAIDAGIAAINVESVAEIEHIADLAGSSHQRARVGVRLNPGKPKGRSGMQMAGDTQFGIGIEAVPEALAAIDRHADRLEFSGFHAHTQSQELDAGAIVENVRRTLELVSELSPQIDQPLRKINFGGGLGVDYFAGQEPLDLGMLGSELRSLVSSADFADLTRGVSLKIEPGRFLVAECGVFATRVLYRKRGLSKDYAIVDGGMNANYVLAGGMGQVIRRNFEMDILGDDVRPAVAPYKLEVAGPLCTPQDVLAAGAELDHEVRVGDIVAFFNCGAYGPSASPVDFLSHERPGERFVDEADG